MGKQVNDAEPRTGAERERERLDLARRRYGLSARDRLPTYVLKSLVAYEKAVGVRHE